MGGRGCGGRGDVRLAPTASTWCGEYDGRMPGTKWSPEQHRRKARATAGFGLRRSDGYSVQMERRGGGFGSVAHGESDEQVGEAGEASERAGRRGGSPAAEEGDDGDGGVTGHSDWLPFVERHSARWRSCWA